mmetsp:Transcript_48546/g.82870  ORF Transcript_48546/g.82870 Transcript_48546/m.82870 type:complete len:293 (+) Transcript_48546:1-879(+)
MIFVSMLMALTLGAKTSLSLAPRRRLVTAKMGPRSVAITRQLPADFTSTLDLIIELRQDRTAVVDRMGSETMHDAAYQVGADEATAAYQVLVSLMMSSQTKDVVNFEVMKKLRAHGLSVDNILATSEPNLNALIKQVGFHNVKTRNILAATAILREKHRGQVPDTMGGLLELPGVGPKMALIFLNVVHGKVEGISVDTHVHRITRQLGWASEEAKRPEQTRKQLEALLPKELWREMNVLLVGLGQETQTEMPKLLGKCLSCSRPEGAFQLLVRLGVNVEKQLVKAGLSRKAK